MRITFDPKKRELTRRQRGLDFADAAEVFAEPVHEQIDARRDYGETRIQTVGWLRGRMVLVVWTSRGATRRIISMRYCHAKEEKRWRDALA